MFLAVLWYMTVWRQLRRIVRMNIFIEKYGTPRQWVCPDCGILFEIYPGGLPLTQDDHNCEKKRIAPKICPCWWRLIDDHRVESFVVVGLVAPEEMTIETLAPDGTKQFWERRRENGRDVFYPPQCYRDAEFAKAILDVERGALMRPGPKHILELVPRPMEEKLALHNRQTILMSNSS